MKVTSNISLHKSVKSFSYALRGIKLVFRNENNAKIHFILSILAVGLSIYFGIFPLEWLWISLAITLVWMAEIFNSALEKLTDLVSPQYHPIAGAAKDMAAGAVLITAVFAIITALIIFTPYVTKIFQL